MIKLENISFGYDSAKIIDDLSLCIPSGEWLGLVGPNGAGKTTLLKLISGYLKPASGKILLDGASISEYSRNAIAQLIAVVPQTATYTFAFSALDIVLMGRSPYIKTFAFESSDDIMIAEESMRKTDTWNFRSRTMGELSGGERQRVLIARALAQTPKILLLDEPTTFLDLKHQMDVMNILTELNRSGLTIVSAIHDVNLAISYCKKIALLGSGKIFGFGEPTEVITYKNLKELFNAEVYVGTNEFTGKPYYVPMAKL